METLSLVRPTAVLEKSCLAARDEFFALDGQEYMSYLPGIVEDFPDFLQRLQAREAGIDLPPGLVAQSAYWLVRNGCEIVGQVALRYHLTPLLKIEGGHIGYAIRPTERRKGYGTRILALILEIARAKGFTRVLVTCNTENIGSARIIQKNGGIFEGEASSPYTGKPVSRYWIEL